MAKRPVPHLATAPVADPPAVRPSSEPVAGGRTRRSAAGLWARVRATPRPLAILLGIGVIQAVAWSVVTPPLQGPDESGHVAYVQHVAETGYKPDFSSGNGSVSTEEDTALFTFGLSPLIGNQGAKPAFTKA